MRPSLENIEFIENYILGNFDPSEQELAEARIQGSSELSKLLETQQCIYTATRRKALRSEIRSYAPAGGSSFFQRYRYWFMGGLGVLAIIACVLILSSNNQLKKQSTDEAQATRLTISKNEQNIVPWIPFDVQVFELIAEKGGTIVGQDGTLIILGANSLLHANGKPVTGKVKAELIEAIDWEDMIAYNLTTTSNGKALSSGGMMRIRYKQNGEEVYVDPSRPMHVEIPTDDYNPEMKVWEGEVKDGQLDWKNPQDIERYLTPVGLHYLDFVPTGFDAEVAAILPYNGHTNLSSKLVDSLYYSISTNREVFSVNRESRSTFEDDCYFKIPKRKDLSGHPDGQQKPLLKGKKSVTGQIVGPDGNPIAGMEVRLLMDRFLENDVPVITDEHGYFTFNKFYSGTVSIYASLHSDDDADILWKYCLSTTFDCPKGSNNHTLKEPLVAQYTSMIDFERLSVLPKTGGLFIDPLRIKALKTSRFQNTFIATKEFQERLQVMHQLSQGASLLNIYVNNLSRPLWECDKMAAQILSGEGKQVFEKFADQKLTNVQNNSMHQEALMAHYTSLFNTYRIENQRRLTDYQAKTSQEINALTKAIETNLQDAEALAAEQALLKGRTTGNSRIVKTRSKKSKNTVRTDSYAFSWSSNSWCNIDRFLDVIGPAPWVTDIQTNRSDKDITVYRTVRELQTVIGLKEQGGSYQSLSSKNSKYDDVFCVAMFREDDQLYYGGRSYNPKNTRDLDLNLTPVSEDEFYQNLCSLAPSESLVANKLRGDYDQLKVQARIMKENEPYTLALEAAKNEVSTEVVVYNRLFDFLDRFNKNLVQ